MVLRGSQMQLPRPEAWGGSCLESRPKLCAHNSELGAPILLARRPIFKSRASPTDFGKIGSPQASAAAKPEPRAKTYPRTHACQSDPALDNGRPAGAESR